MIKRLSGFYDLILRVLNHISKSSFLTSCYAVLFFTFVDAIVERLSNQELTRNVMLFLSYFKVMGFVSQGLGEHIFLVSSTSLSLHFFDIYSVRNDI
jgi:hypothetical protein